KMCVIQPNFAGIVVKGPTNTYRPGYQLVIRNSTKASTVISNNDGNWTGLIGQTPLDNGGWHFITLIVTPLANTVKIYVDGKLDGTATNPIIEPDFQDQQQPLFIGKERNSSVFFRGSIDDIRIFNRAITESEILDLYNENGWTGSRPQGF